MLDARHGGAIHAIHVAVVSPHCARHLVGLLKGARPFSPRKYCRITSPTIFSPVFCFLV